MDEHQRISFNSSSIVSSKTYDVFLSFRGEDTRLNFTSHLYKALNEKKIKTFIDDQLKKGDKISLALTKTIEDSHVSIIIFSKNYAFSKWCLDELSKIMECEKVQGQIVIPVFYNIDTSHVRKQTGSYEEAFAKHRGDYRYNKWRNDLTEAANISGCDSKNSINDVEFIDNIVKVVMEKLPPRYLNHRKGLVGIEKIYEEIKPLLKIGSDDSNEVITFGIWGMRGIGKTTLANALYEKLSGKFESCHFFANVTEKSEEVVHKDLYSKLSGKNISSYDPLELCLLLQTERVLIVLDDVTTPKKLEELIYQFYPLGLGSRVIVTTRNKQIFRSDAIKYMVQGLKFHHSLELFWLTAFEEKQPKNGYEDISYKVVSYCKGVPLALKVVGASLRSKSKEVWECQMNKLQSIPNMEIQKVLKLSYDDLDDSQQSIFLDIACFLKGERRDNIFPIYEIEVLLDKSLITIQKNKNGEVIEMHDLIQEMGNEIVRQESIKYPERRSRLWKHEEVVDVLKKNKENDIVEGIILNLELLNENLNLSNDFLAKMINLRFFKIYKEYYWIKQEQFNIYLHDNLESLSDKLRYFHWDNCCLKSLPSKFCAEQLVVLIMLNSKLKKLWDGVQNLWNLKEIDLRGSKRLTNIPDLSKATKLVRVNLSECRKIKSLNIHSKYLSELYLDGCLSLAEISVTSDKLTRLNLLKVLMLTQDLLKHLNSLAVHLSRKSQWYQTKLLH